MALVFNDRVKETSTTTGTGTLDLGGAFQDFQTFVAGIGNSNETYYNIVLPQTGEFEVGRGVVTDASPDTLSRLEVFTSSNSGNLVDFSAGTKTVFCTLPASKAVIKDASGNIPIDANKTIEFGDSGETISGDGTNLTISSSQNLNINTANELKLDSIVGINLLDNGSSYGLLVDASGDFVIKSQQSDKDIIIKGNDGGSTVNALTLDMSNAGSATFNNSVSIGDNLHLGSDSSILLFGAGNDVRLTHVHDVGLLFTNETTSAPRLQFQDAGEYIEGDGTNLTIASSNNTTIDSVGSIFLDADNNGLVDFKDGGTTYLRVSEVGNDAILKSFISDGNFLIKGNDGGVDTTALTFDMSEAGAATFNDKIILGASKSIEFGDAGESISGDGTDLTISTSNDVTIDSARDIILDGDQSIKLRDGGAQYASISNSSGVRFTSQISDNDILFRGNDGGSFITALTLDMSEAGAATFNAGITATTGTISGDLTVDTNTLHVDSSNNRVGIGTTSPARDLQIAKSTSGGTVRLEVNNESNTGSSHGVISIYSGGTSGGDPYLHFKVDNGEQYSIGIDNDQSDAFVLSNNFGVGSNNLLSIATDGATTFSDKVILGANKSIEFGDSGENISGDGTNLTVTSSGFFLLDVTGNILLDSANNGFIALRDNGTSYINFAENSGDAILTTPINDGDFLIKGNDGGSEITALTFDMSEAGVATFNSSVTVGANLDVSSGGAKIKLAGSYPVGINNVALGSNAGANLNSGSQSNTLIGVSAGNNISGSDYNTAVGNQALRIGGGNLRENTAVGYAALEASVGPGNTAVGYQAGNNISTGNNNTVIGASATASSGTVDNEITLGNSSVTSLRIPGLQSGASSGDVLTFNGTDIGFATPSTGVSAGFTVAMAIAL